MPVYNKLVRDNIPGLIQGTNKQFSTRVLSKEEYRVELKKKMNEEISEYQDAATNEEAVEELADILELIHSAAKMHGATTGQLEEIRRAKAERRGGFEKRILLIEVDD